MMRYCGYSEYFHDAGLAFVNQQGEIEFAAHAERYTKRKFENEIPAEMWEMVRADDHVTFYEDHRIRRGKWIDDTSGDMCRLDRIPGHHQFVMMDALNHDDFILHHQSHAASGYYTRPWDSTDDTVILTVDGVGELMTMTIQDHNLNILENWEAPLSIGHMYTRATKLMGLKAMEDEYVVMGMSAYGEPIYGDYMIDWFNDLHATKARKPHIRDIQRINSLMRYLYHEKDGGCRKRDLAASVQYFTEHQFNLLAKKASQYGSKLIVSGGCAQNIIAMSNIKQSGLFEDMFIAVGPTDAGSALGAAAYQYCKQMGENKIKWNDAFIGYDMGCSINPKEVVDHLLEHEYCGIASGRAEFGPRALGNRSLIADVRKDVKDTVNRVKQRQEFRPFAPAILEEYADEYFEGPMNEYMQYQANAKHDYKSVTHVDGTARVQLVKKDSTSIFRKIIEEYYDRTGVPMLLNTSLNIRGMPMVNDLSDAEAFEREYNVKVFS